MTEPVIPATLAALEALLAKATPEPWKFCKNNGSYPPDGKFCLEFKRWEDGKMRGDYGGIHIERVNSLHGPTIDLELIVALRNAAPALIALLLAQREALEFIAEWKLPSVKVRDEKMNYEEAYGSNGARDYMIARARAALGASACPASEAAAPLPEAFRNASTIVVALWYALNGLAHAVEDAMESPEEAASWAKSGDMKGYIAKARAALGASA